MPTTLARARLRELFNRRELIVAPGVYDGLTAQLARRTGHTAAYLTGAGVAAAGFGLPDIGLGFAVAIHPSAVLAHAALGALTALCQLRGIKADPFLPSGRRNSSTSSGCGSSARSVTSSSQRTEPEMGMTIIEKILSRKAGLAAAAAGDTVTVDVDMTVLIDLQFATLWMQPLKIDDSGKVAIVMDHAVPAPTIKDAAGGPKARKFAAEKMRAKAGSRVRSTTAAQTRARSQAA